MKTRTTVRQVVILAVLLCTALALADMALSQVQPPPPSAQIARSALLTIQGAVTEDALSLQIRRVKDQSPISGDSVTVSIDGKSESVTRGADGSYRVPLDDLRGGGSRDIEIVVAHDGIREILSGKLSAPQESPSESLLRDHKQIAWWILNIVIVLIAAIAISRRKG